MNTVEEFADKIVADHIATINWDEGDMDALRENSIKMLEAYAELRVKEALNKKI